MIIVDPTTEEESLATALITAVTDEDDQLCAFHKPGSKSFFPLILNRIRIIVHT